MRVINFFIRIGIEYINFIILNSIRLRNCAAQRRQWRHHFLLLWNHSSSFFYRKRKRTLKIRTKVGISLRNEGLYRSMRNVCLHAKFETASKIGTKMYAMNGERLFNDNDKMICLLLSWHAKNNEISAVKSSHKSIDRFLFACHSPDLHPINRKTYKIQSKSIVGSLKIRASMTSMFL